MGEWAKISLDKYQELNRAAKRVNATPETEGDFVRARREDGGVARLVVQSVADDYLVCRAWDGTTAGTVDIYVAKPPWLRKTPYHGKTITISGVALTFNYTNGFTRTVSKSGGSETQIIIPAYTGTGAGYNGEEIFAAYIGVNGINDPSGKPIGLVEVYSGRMWAKQ